MQYKMYKKEYKKKPMGSKTLLMKGTVIEMKKIPLVFIIFIHSFAMYLLHISMYWALC